jgi:hypothetical protein
LIAHHNFGKQVKNQKMLPIFVTGFCPTIVAMSMTPDMLIRLSRPARISRRVPMWG